MVLVFKTPLLSVHILFFAGRQMAFHLELAAEAGTCTAGLPAFIPLSAATTLLGRGADGAAALTGLGDAVHVQLNHCPPAGCEWQQGIVSRQHARISVAGSAVTLTDVSANGTEVDGVGLARDAAAALRVGSVVAKEIADAWSETALRLPREPTEKLVAVVRTVDYPRATS